MSHAVFICYADEDRNIAEKLCATLERHHIQCWIAPRDVVPGASYPEAIARAIDESRVLALILSHAASASPYVLREVEQAVSGNRAVLALRVTTDPPAEGLRFLISSRQWLDATTPAIELHLERAAVAVRSLLESGDASTTAHVNERISAAPAQEGLSFASLRADPASAVGQMVGPYRLESFEGQGGSGWVFRGRHSSLGTEAAVKLFLPMTTDVRELVGPLQGAVRALASTRSPNIARVLDLGTLDLPDGSSLYLITEFIHGTTLDELRATALSTALGLALRLVTAVRDMHGLRYFDAHGIERMHLLHGDLKPSNVIVKHDGTPVLVDFLLPDIQRALDRPDGQRQHAITEILGTPGYMAPEQEREGVLTTATDVYALGQTLRHLFGDWLQYKALRDLLGDMTLPDPAKRPSAAGVLDRLASDFQLRWSAPPAAATVLGGDLRKALVNPKVHYRALDDNVQFTVYRPRALLIETWQPVIAFAHLSEKRANEPDAVDPLEEIDRQARLALGDDLEAFRSTTQDANHAVPREGALTFVLDLPGMKVNPRVRSFAWTEDVHREEFRVSAPAELADETVRGRLTVFLGCIILAEVALVLKVVAREEQAETKPVRDRAQIYRRVFASYSRKDLPIVRQVLSLARALGDEYVRDLTHLRAGEVWSERIPELILRADIFQLFWSSNSMHSPFVRQEWEYALSLNRLHFVRPTYWEEPLPCSAKDGLPPPGLLALHFERLPVVSDVSKDVFEGLQPPPKGVPAPAAERRRSHDRRPVMSRPWRWWLVVFALLLSMGALLVLTYFLGLLPR